jgi:D-threonate/D-erythronate kinase
MSQPLERKTPRIKADLTTNCLVVADDLTGACDASAPFAIHGLRVEVPFGSRALHSYADVIAVSTESRNASEDISLAQLSTALREWDAPDRSMLFKKVDSLCRGNTFAEIGAMDSAFSDRLIFFAPSFPAVARRVVNGCLYLDDANHSTLNISQALSSRGIAHSVLPEDISEKDRLHRIKRSAAGKARFLLCEASSDSVLRAVVRAGLSLDRDLVWIGSGGLAHALAGELHTPNIGPAWRSQTGALIFCVGSNHPSTMRQIDYAMRHGEVTCVRNYEDFLIALPWTLDGCGTLIWIIDPDWSNAMLRAALISILDYPDTTLLLSGGDTAANICATLSVQSISIAGELMPGIPWGYLHGADAEGMRVITKSGGFGAENAFTTLMRICRGDYLH